MFKNDVIFSCCIGVIASLIFSIGLYVQSKASYFWNTKLNRIIYYLSRNDSEYNIVSKEFSYTCINDKEYKCKKHITIYPTRNDVDRISERFAWSARSSNAKIIPLKNEHEIKDIRQQELWTCYSVYFNHTCQKHKEYETGSAIENLIDEHGEAVPFLSATVERKTKTLVMYVKFENKSVSPVATFKVFTPKCMTKELHSEELAYDNIVKGFKCVVNFPRPNWKYVISWEYKNS